MATSQRETFDEFVRLDHADPELSRVEQVEVFAVAARSADELALELLLDPLAVLQRSEVDDIGDDWEVTVERVNAQVPLPLPKPNGKKPGVHHIVAIWMVIRANRHAHCVYYRMPPGPDETSAPSNRRPSRKAASTR
jgi:hypothetical protein